ncbi:hypothetical protein GJ496_004260 [Pomphorhynchus laevis]|nr:hypothetical protein GJ496_004260 [Pomphorhynchus laevis]
MRNPNCLQTSNYVTRASPASDARHIPLEAAINKGLLTYVRSEEKQVQPRNLRLMPLNIGTLTGKSRELAANLKQRHVDIAVVQKSKWKCYKRNRRCV